MYSVERTVGLITYYTGILWYGFYVGKSLQADCMSVALLAAATLLVWLAITFLLVSTVR
jgi:hypothetical protein